jgi:hypothetical protein
MWRSILKKFNGTSCGGGMNDEVKMHLVQWNKVCSPLDEGGLEIRNVRRFNQVLR